MIPKPPRYATQEAAQKAADRMHGRISYTRQYLERAVQRWTEELNVARIRLDGAQEALAQFEAIGDSWRDKAEAGRKVDD